MRKLHPARGISLVEVLIVVAIIAILIQLLLPAIHSARESARNAQCQNHLKQLALGAQMHLDTHGFLPTGGWAGSYTADANRAYGRTQPGGWAFSLLDYIELGAMREAARGESMTSEVLAPGLKQLHQSAPAIFYCPSRRAARPYPTVNTGGAEWGLVVANGAQDLPAVTKLDYAANSGDSLHHAASSFGNSMWWPESYEALESEPQEWTNTNDPDSEFYQTGVSFHRSEVGAEQITDGMSNTYLFGEKYMDPATYLDIRAVPDYARLGDNQSAWAGYEWDNHRVAWQPKATKKEECYQPQQDSGAVCPAIWSFGSAHAGAMNMAFCDGSVRSIGYEIDRDVHRRSANRLDGEVQ